VFVPLPTFLQLPDRSVKPRRQGLTSVIDGGMPLAEVEAIVASTGHLIDIWKLGWGSSYVDRGLDAKLDVLRAHGVTVCPGGTLLEVAALQGQVDALLDWAAACAFTHVEVSDGLGQLGDDKAALIARAAQRFVVIAEVGMKDPDAVLTPAEWAQQVADDFASGATWVIAEGRESGTVGMYAADGTVRTDVVDALVDRVDTDRVLFEAPRKDQQAWLIGHLGAEVNLANIAPRDVLGLEALRLGLRADTALGTHAASLIQ
jgi:phosphosulfolactate synthase